MVVTKRCSDDVTLFVDLRHVMIVVLLLTVSSDPLLTHFAGHASLYLVLFVGCNQRLAQHPVRTVRVGDPHGVLLVVIRQSRHSLITGSLKVKCCSFFVFLYTINNGQGPFVRPHVHFMFCLKLTRHCDVFHAKSNQHLGNI